MDYYWNVLRCTRSCCIYLLFKYVQTTSFHLRRRWARGSVYAVVRMWNTIHDLRLRALRSRLFSCVYSVLSWSACGDVTFLIWQNNDFVYVAGGTLVIVILSAIRRYIFFAYHSADATLKKISSFRSSRYTCRTVYYFSNDSCSATIDSREKRNTTLSTSMNRLSENPSFRCSAAIFNPGMYSVSKMHTRNARYWNALKLEGTYVN